MQRVKAPKAELCNPTAFTDEALDSGINGLFKRLAKATGIRPCNPHKMQRTFAVMSLRAGMDAYTLKRLMGQRFYATGK